MILLEFLSILSLDSGCQGFAPFIIGGQLRSASLAQFSATFFASISERGRQSVQQWRRIRQTISIEFAVAISICTAIEMCWTRARTGK